MGPILSMIGVDTERSRFTSTSAPSSGPQWHTPARSLARAVGSVRHSQDHAQLVGSAGREVAPKAEYLRSLG
jgi:hypothetical protein